ncbi:MAG: glycosyltransferase family 4 protein [Holosporales bacterium]
MISADLKFWGPTLLATALLANLLGRAMIAYNIEDIPSDRSSHSVPTPRGAGAGIVIAFFAFCFFVIAWRGLAGAAADTLILAGLALLLNAFTGAIDDVRGLAARTRLIVQVLAAAMVIEGGISITRVSLPIEGEVYLGVSGVVLSLFWLVGYTNAYNFMDGMNGLAGITAVIIAATLAVVSWQPAPPLAILAAGLAAALVGFIPLNYPQARIFLGDVGSQFIGLLLAIFALLAHEWGNLSLWAIPILFFCHLFDTGLTLLRRLARGENLFKAHREHLFQLLQRSGLSHAGVTGLYVLCTLLQGVCVVLLEGASAEAHLTVLGGFILLGTVYAVWVHRRFARLGEAE